MIKSMTAFSRAEEARNHLTVQAEIRTYNSRYLDLSLRLPGAYQVFEDRIKALVSAQISRGRVELYFQIVSRATDSMAFEIDWPKADAYVTALRQLKDRFELSAEIQLDLLVNSGNLLKPADVKPDESQDWEVIQACLVKLLDDHNAMRRKEGLALSADFDTRLANIEAQLKRIGEMADELPVLYRNRLNERINRLTKGLVEIDPARIAQEAALLADRSDISEELVRAASHINQYRDLMNAPDPAGRKLNFLLQEMNREFNTMGAKSGNALISHIIVAVKSELEKIREQVQNVE